MATAQSEASRAAADAQTAEFERFIDSQVRKARRQVRWIDLAAGLIAIAAGALAYLLLVAMLDHWVVRGGLGFGGRIASLLVLAAGAGAYFVYALLPPIMRSVNPVYAAQTIERSHPTLKNSLVNLLLLRSSRRGVARSIYAGLEAQTAAGLADVHVEQAVDRSRLVKLGWILLGVVAVGAVYTLASPKDPLRSIGRIIAPWADIAAPTRVAIRDVQPGAVRAFHDDFVQVSAEVTGIDDGESVTLFFTTSDDQAVNQPVEMTAPPGELRYRAELPPSAGGLQQDLVYYIAAGDAISPKYRIDVLITPSIVVDRVDYTYPDYTEIKPRSVDRRGDLSAIDGTRVTIHATANDDIRSAYVDFDCDGRRDMPMRVDGRTATADFRLAMKSDGSGPEHASYQLRFQNADGAENPKPVRYEIQITGDESPTVAIVDPATLEPDAPWEMAADDVLSLRIEGEDPDFKLSALNFVAEKDGRSLAESPLLAEPRGGVVTGDYLLNPAALGLKAGDTATFWAVADDNRQPRPNRAETPHYSLRVTSPQTPQDARNAKQPQDRQQPRNDQPNQQRPDQQRQQKQQPGEAADDREQPQDGEQRQPDNQQQDQQDRQQQQRNQDQQNSDEQQGEQDSNQQGEGGQSQQGEQSDDRQSDQQDSGQGGERRDSAGGQGDKSDSQQGDGQQGSEEPPDADAQPGDVFDKILERARQQQSDETQQQPNPGENDERPSDDGQQNQDANDNQEPQSGEPSADDKQDSQQSAGGEQGNERQQSGDQAPNKQDKEQRQDASNNNAGDQGDQRRGDQKQSPEQKDGEKRPGEQQGGAKQDEQQPNDEAQDSGQEERQADGEGERTAGDTPQDRPGAESGTDKSSGEGSSAEKQGADPGGQRRSQGGEAQKPDAGQGGEPSQAGDPQTGETKPGNDQPKPGESAASRDSNQQDVTGAEPSPGGQSGEPSPGSKVEREKRNGRDAQKLPDDARLPADRDETGEPQSDKQASDSQGDPGKGDQTRGAGEQGERSEDNEKPKEQTGGENSEHSQGDPGAGEKAGSDGSPSPQEGNRPREKSPKPTASDSEQPDQKATSPSGSRNQSDSQSSQSGDQSGGGKDGGGQRSDQSGTGSAGQNMESDQGAGVGQQSGDGVTGQQGGDQQVGDSSDPNAQTKSAPGDRSQAGGEEAGPGQETSQPMAEGDRAAGQEQPQGNADQSQQPQQSPGGQQGAQPNQGQTQPQGSEQPREGTSRGGGNPAGGGLPGDDDSAAPPRPQQAGDTPAGDDPNLEYTRKATDLALQYLKDQLQNDKVDQELLDELQWSREDMERFVRQWEEMKKQAERVGSDGDAARRKLDDSLRGLGLRPQGTTIRGGQRSEQRGPRVRDSRRSSPPPEYIEQYKAYTSGSGREE